MEAIKRKYIVDEDNNKIAVQLDIDTFNKIEEALEDYALYNLISENQDDETLDLDDARKFYSNLEKSS
jgi:hypothetical protein